MIFYTISGPTTRLIIRDDQLILKAHGPFAWFSSHRKPHTIALTEIKLFSIVKTFGFMGKVTISDGTKTYEATFSSTYKMVEMIEKYMQKRILKNTQKENSNVVSISERREKRDSEKHVEKTSPSIAA